MDQWQEVKWEEEEVIDILQQAAWSFEGLWLHMLACYTIHQELPFQELKLNQAQAFNS